MLFHLPRARGGVEDARVSHRETYRNTVTYALSIVGGSERMLAEKLGVRLGDLINYLTGVEEVPTEVFLRAVDVVLAATAEDIRHARTILEKLKYERQQGR